MSPDELERLLRDAGRSHEPNPEWQRAVWKRIEQRTAQRVARHRRIHSYLTAALVVVCLLGALALVILLWGWS